MYEKKFKLTFYSSKKHNKANRIWKICVNLFKRIKAIGKNENNFYLIFFLPLLLQKQNP